MSDAQDAYQALYVYTMGRAGFILQHVVDANMAQRLDTESKPISAIFALAGLYLHVEKGFTGSQVQRAHAVLARRKRDWPAIALPEHRGEITAADVMSAPAGPQRDAAITRWCASVWAQFAGSRDVVVRLLQDDAII
ncbi:MAG: DUF5946 family protein [Vicinamibacterales bacterium]